jgi:hypothetical protein
MNSRLMLDDTSGMRRQVRRLQNIGARFREILRTFMLL